MPDGSYIRYEVPAAAGRRQYGARAILLGAVLVAAVIGFLATSPSEAAYATKAAGPELTNLLRAMAGMKAVAALGLISATLWRLATPARPLRVAVYTIACVAMAAGPGLIWNMAHLKLGALFLHAGLLATVIVLWRDPAVGARLGEIIERRRAALRVAG